MKVLVTGGGGFLGSHLIEQLIKNEAVEKIYNIDPMVEGFNKDNLFFHKKVQNICIEQASMSRSSWAFWIQDIKPDIIYSIGSLTHVDTSLERPDLFMRYNCEVFTNLLEQVRIIKPNTRIVHMSTDEVFGSISDDSIDEYGFGEEDVEYSFCPSSAYSASKALQEQLCTIYRNSYNLDITIIRATNLFGKRQDKKKFIPKVIDCIKKDLDITVYGRGEQLRTWLHVSDAVRFLELFISNRYDYKTFHISNIENEVTNLELALLLQTLSGKEPEIVFVQDRINHDFRYSLDYTLTSGVTGWTPVINLEEGLREVLSL